MALRDLHGDKVATLFTTDVATFFNAYNKQKKATLLLVPALPHSFALCQSWAKCNLITTYKLRLNCNSVVDYTLFSVIVNVGS